MAHTVYVFQVLRKAAYKLVNAEAEAPHTVDPDNLKDFVGQPIGTTDRRYPESTPAGGVMGLAWTSMGGSVLYIECTNKEPLRTRKTSKAGDDDEGASSKGTYFHSRYPIWSRIMCSLPCRANEEFKQPLD